MNDDQKLQSLIRGLTVLVHLNRYGMTNVSQLARQMGLPRTTTERILMTLAGEGFLERSANGRKYTLVTKVCALSSGFSDDNWIAHVAEPLLFERTRQTGWPLAVVAPFGLTMRVRMNTDPATPLWLLQRRVGSGVTMANAGSGLVYLAFAPEAQREVLLELLSSPDQPDNNRIDNLPRYRDQLETVAVDGYALTPSAGSERAICVPIFMDGQIKAVLIMVYMTKALTPKAVLETFLPELRALSEEVARRAVEARGQPFAVIDAEALAQVQMAS